MTEPAGLRWTRVAVLLLCLSEASQTNRNYYEALGVEPAATERQIKRAFRKLATRCHPDRNTGAGAEEAFREVAEAYSVLSDQEKRKLYDSSLENVASEDEQETSFHFSFFQDFEEVFTEEPHFHWSFYQDGEDDESRYDHFSFNRPD